MVKKIRKTVTSIESSSDTELNDLGVIENGVVEESIVSKPKRYTNKNSTELQETMGLNTEKNEEDHNMESSESIGSSISNVSSNIHIELSGLSQNKINQLKRLKSLIRTSQAYSIYFYILAYRWKICYWVTMIFAVSLAALTAVINIFYDRCSEDSSIRQINVLLNTLIAASIAVITTLNASLQQKENEDAGDDYKNFSQSVYREVFLNDIDYESCDLSAIIEKHSSKFDDFTKAHREPHPATIKKILCSKEYEVSLTFLS